jgi:capsular exopolysaccharide synthesis family protein
MSRFYNALREASRWQPSKESGWDGLTPPSETESAAAPSSPEATAAPAATAAATATATQVEAPPIHVFEEEFQAFSTPPETAPRRGFFGRQADVNLDQKARLIPHAVDPGVVEHYRKLRTKIMQQYTTKAFRSLVVTSPNPGEGKSVTALNLGLSFAMLPNFRVVVVDGDLRKGSLGRWLGVTDRPGLSNLIDGSAKLEDVVLKSDESPMCFVVRGTSEVSPGELLNSADLSTHFRHLSEHFDLIVVDSPPVNLITDTQLLAASCDAVLLVARAFSTTQKAFQKTVQDMAPFRVIGTILNGGIKSKGYGGYGYGYGKGYY